MIPTPEDVSVASSSVAGWIGAGIATIIAAAVGLRRWLSGDAAARAGDRAEIGFLETLMDQLAKANERADRFAKERNEAIEQIGELKAQIAALQLTVNHMQRQIDIMMGDAT